MVSFISECPKEIEHPGARVPALFAKTVFEVAREGSEEVHLWPDDGWADGFESQERIRRWVTGFKFEMVGHVAEEAQAIRGRPEERVD